MILYTRHRVLKTSTDARRYNDMKKSNPFNIIIMIALTISSALYALQIWEVINVSILTILSPVIVASAIIVAIMILASAVALKYNKQDERTISPAECRRVRGSHYRRPVSPHDRSGSSRPRPYPKSRDILRAGQSSGTGVSGKRLMSSRARRMRVP